jgi:hypothetical protein
MSDSLNIPRSLNAIEALLRILNRRRYAPHWGDILPVRRAYRAAGACLVIAAVFVAAILPGLHQAHEFAQKQAWIAAAAQDASLECHVSGPAAPRPPGKQQAPDGNVCPVCQALQLLGAGLPPAHALLLPESGNAAKFALSAGAVHPPAAVPGNARSRAPPSLV